MPQKSSTQALPRRRILASYSMDAEQASDWLRKILHTLAHSAAESLQSAGAEVIFVDAGRTSEEPAELIKSVDGVVVLGGADLDPATYGQSAQTDNLYGVNPQADAFELSLTNAALDAGVPFLGICRGMQVLNVALGGTLSQDLGADTIHNIESDNSTMTGHSVRVLPDTLLERIYKTNALDIRSGHHQAVAEVGNGLQVSAEAEDGTIEAVEAPGSWTLGVQWHPEDPDADSQQLTTLMSEFARQCALTASKTQSQEN